MIFMKVKNIRYGTRGKHTDDKGYRSPWNKIVKQLIACVVVFFICTPISKTEIGMKRYISDTLTSTSDIEQSKTRFSEMCTGLTEKHPTLADNYMWNGFLALIDTQPPKEEKVVPEPIQSEPQTPQEALELVAKAAPEEYVYPDSVNMIAPLSGKITSPFGGREDPVAGGDGTHHGIDIAGDFGDTIISTAPGKVLKVGEDEIYGKYVLIQHTENIKSLYAHCQEICVIEGEIVDGNTLIARVGSTGLSTGPHLHFEIRVDDKAVNPEDYVVVSHIE